MSVSSREAGGASEQSVQAVERREWWPQFLVDEEMPAGRDTPDAWLYRLADGAHAYGTEDWGMPELAEGEIVTFTACDALGTAVLTFDADSKPIWETVVPAGADHLWDGEDIIAESPDDFAEQIFESSVRGHIAGERFTATLSRWPGDAIRFRFTALDGPPRFVPLDPIPEPPGIFLAPAADTQSDLFTPTPEA